MDVRAAQEVVQRRVLRHALAGRLRRSEGNCRVGRHAGALQPLLLRIDARLHGVGRLCCCWVFVSVTAKFRA